MAEVLVIEDERVLGRSLAHTLRSEGHEVRIAYSAKEGLQLSQTGSPDVALVDLRLPDGSGLDVLARLIERDPSTSVVVMTAYGSVGDAVEAMRRGAVDYVQKPLDLEEVRLLVERLTRSQRQARELAYLRDRDGGQPGSLIGSSPRFTAIFEQVRRLSIAKLAPGQRPAILLTGETGTGKGVIARAIHAILGGGPFIDLNCTTLPAPLVEAELFGHERGSFTDAKASRAGLFEAAAGGAVFLDEIGDLELGAQAKFLKVVEEKRVRRLGSTRDREIDVHVIAATHRNLDREVDQGRFREDLLHRLRVLSFEVPPLRERRGDIRGLAEAFATELGARYGRPDTTIAPSAFASLESYGWPGNIRELRNVVERAVLLAPSGELDASLFGGLLFSKAGPEDLPVFRLPESGLDLQALERDLIRQALERTKGNRTRAAGLLGLSRDTLRYRLEKFQLA